MYILSRDFNLLDQLLKSPYEIPWWLRMRRPLSDSLHAVRVVLAALCCMVTARYRCFYRCFCVIAKKFPLGASGYVPLSHLPRMTPPRNLLCVFSQSDLVQNNRPHLHRWTTFPTSPLSTVFIYSSPTFSVTSFACHFSYLQSADSPEGNNAWVVNCMPFWALW